MTSAVGMSGPRRVLVGSLCCYEYIKSGREISCIESCYYSVYVSDWSDEEIQYNRDWYKSPIKIILCCTVKVRILRRILNEALNKIISIICERKIAPSLWNALCKNYSTHFMQEVQDFLWNALCKNYSTHFMHEIQEFFGMLYARTAVSTLWKKYRTSYEMLYARTVVPTLCKKYRNFLEYFMQELQYPVHARTTGLFIQRFMQKLQYPLCEALFVIKSREVWSRSLAHTLCSGIATAEFNHHVAYTHLWRGD